MQIHSSTFKGNRELEQTVRDVKTDLESVRSPLSGTLSGSATYDAASLADGAGATTTVTVTGAALGDFAFVSFSLDLQGISVTAYVTAANTVAVRLQNETTGVVDLASGTLRARVIPQASFAAPSALLTT